MESLPNVEATRDGDATTYSWDVLASLEDIAIQLILLQAFEETAIAVRLDARVEYDDYAPPGSERRTPASSCFVATAMNTTRLAPFYLGRALGQETETPAEQRPVGPGFGHARGAAGSFVRQGDVFEELDGLEGRLPAGGWMLFSNGISQITTASAQSPENHWRMNWTVSGPHRVIQIPAAPLFCHFGLGETQDATVHIEDPIPYVEGSALEVKTRYGSTAILANNAGDAVSQAVTAENRAVIDFLGTRCRADAQTTVVQSSFAQGLMRIDVERWAAYPEFIFAGLGPWELLIGVMDQDRTCTPP